MIDMNDKLHMTYAETNILEARLSRYPQVWRRMLTCPGPVACQRHTRDMTTWKHMRL